MTETQKKPRTTKTKTTDPVEAAQQPETPIEAAQQPETPVEAAQQPETPIEAAQQPETPVETTEITLIVSNDSKKSARCFVTDIAIHPNTPTKITYANQDDAKKACDNFDKLNEIAGRERFSVKIEGLDDEQ